MKYSKYLVVLAVILVMWACNKPKPVEDKPKSHLLPRPKLVITPKIVFEGKPCYCGGDCKDCKCTAAECVDPSPDKPVEAQEKGVCSIQNGRAGVPVLRRLRWRRPWIKTH